MTSLLRAMPLPLQDIVPELEKEEAKLDAEGADEAEEEECCEPDEVVSCLPCFVPSDKRFYLPALIIM